MKKKWFASDLAFKIYSVLIAIFLWVFVIYLNVWGLCMELAHDLEDIAQCIALLRGAST